MTYDNPKRAAAAAALALVEPGMRLGLGTGSTAWHFVDLLAAKVAAGLDVLCVPTSEATRAQADATIEEVARLVQTAAAAPQAAAEVIAGLRQTLSESMARDNDMLAERSQMLATLDTLLAAVNHASTEQRAAIDALVATSADLLDRVGSRFAERVEAEGGRLDAATAQLAAGAVEVASLGEAFGVTLQSFASANEALAGKTEMDAPIAYLQGLGIKNEPVSAIPVPVGHGDKP